MGAQVEEEIASGPHELESSFARTGPRSARRPSTPIPRRGSASNMLDQSTTQVSFHHLRQTHMLSSSFGHFLPASACTSHLVNAKGLFGVASGPGMIAVVFLTSSACKACWLC